MYNEKWKPCEPYTMKLMEVVRATPNLGPANFIDEDDDNNNSRTIYACGFWFCTPLMMFQDQNSVCRHCLSLAEEQRVAPHCALPKHCIFKDNFNHRANIFVWSANECYPKNYFRRTHQACDECRQTYWDVSVGR